MINFRWNSVIPKRFDFILLLFLLKVSDFETGWFISLLVQKFSSTLLCSLFPQLTFFYKSSKHWILYLYALVSFWIGCNESGRYLIVDPRKSDKALPIGFSSYQATKDSRRTCAYVGRRHWSCAASHSAPKRSIVPKFCIIKPYTYFFLKVIHLPTQS